MARNPRTRGARRTLVWFATLLLGLAALLAGVNTWGTAQATPKLGLDLEGGTQMILAPQVGEGVEVNEQQLSQAVDIMRARVDSQGVAEAEVATLGSNVVVSVPGEMTKEQEESLRQSSQMRFRPVLAMLPAQPEPTPAPTGTSAPTGAPTPGASPSGRQSVAPGGKARPTATPTPTATRTANAVAPEALKADAATADARAGSRPAASPSPSPTPKPDLLRQPVLEEGAPGLTRITPADRADPEKLIAYATNGAWLQAPSSMEKIQALDCASTDRPDPTKEDQDLPIAACDLDGGAKYLLGPAVISGDQLADASSGNMTNQQGQPMPGYQVNLEMKPESRDLYRVVSQSMLGLQQPRNQLATVLDGRVVSAPYFSSVIPDGRAAISGNFTADSAQMLANQLKFGALPMSFRVETQDTVSPTLGADQLSKGLLAGAIGFVLVMIYALIQYRALGLVTVASLLAAAALTYLCITLLGWSQNFRLSMAGVTGLILSIGMTADSFIVYFERVRDEIREGRSIPAAVEAGWQRAKGTVIISDAVNLIAAVVLYLLASSNVRGFAYTLGLTTIIDVIIVFFFTHPMLALLSRTTFFGQGHKLSGFDPDALGAKPARYVGRGRFRDPDAELEALETERAATKQREGSYTKEGGAVL
ncbi:protein translocase subunit SecD [Arsenicicoccus sp. UBA6765]|uniref:protein translocase subunit SecD n=1 Tax=Arsenicicoccus sp. UBA6765 TaxID=1946056 RepID=UPI00257E51DE|nr:protein translocase subunit SecD [Arsenicicoccus sp. UBA6765]